MKKTNRLKPSEPSDRQLADAGNALARQFYAAMGYAVDEGYRFDNATHPQEALCWQLACIAYEKLAATELDSATYAYDEP